MEKSSSYDELTIRHQFDRLCYLTIDRGVASYLDMLKKRSEKERVFSDLSRKELNGIFVMDEYDVEKQRFQVLGYEVDVRDALIAEALMSLSERKRNVILLSYFLEMNDAEIARQMNLVRSTVHEHRTGSLRQMKKILEEYTDEKRSETDK